MNKQARPMTDLAMRSATTMSSSRVAELMKRAKSVADDSQQERRLAEQRCKACFYFTALGGAAMTSQPCMSCGEVQLYSSTNTSVMCLPCAKAGDLCRHCGGDIAMDTGRTTWPKAYTEANASGNGG